MRKVCVFCRYNDWLISYHSSVVKVPSIERAGFYHCPKSLSRLFRD
jgi:hypothetical protein